MALQIPSRPITADPASQSRSLFDAYMCARRVAWAVPTPRGPQLEEIQRAVRAWIDDSGVADTAADYEHYDRERFSAKVLGLAGYLRTAFPGVVPEAELVAAELMLESAFETYEYSIVRVILGQVGEHRCEDQIAAPAVAAPRVGVDDHRRQADEHQRTLLGGHVSHHGADRLHLPAVVETSA
jgi:hypothetical protein